jgi:hypothetical protein
LDLRIKIKQQALLCHSAAAILECADLSALWSLATCRQQRRDRSRRAKSGDRSPHSKKNF